MYRPIYHCNLFLRKNHFFLFIIYLAGKSGPVDQGNLIQTVFTRPQSFFKFEPTLATPGNNSSLHTMKVFSGMYFGLPSGNVQGNVLWILLIYIPVSRSLYPVYFIQNVEILHIIYNIQISLAVHRDIFLTISANDKSQNARAPCFPNWKHLHIHLAN